MNKDKKQNYTGLSLIVLGLLCAFVSLFSLHLFGPEASYSWKFVIPALFYLVSMFGVGYTYGGFKEGREWIYLWVSIGVVAVVGGYLIRNLPHAIRLLLVIPFFFFMLWAFRFFINEESFWRQKINPKPKV